MGGGGEHADVGSESGDLGADVAADLLGREHGDAGFEGEPLDLGRDALAGPTARSVRLGDGGDEVDVGRGDEATEGGEGVVGGAEEDDAHASMVVAHGDAVGDVALVAVVGWGVMGIEGNGVRGRVR